MTAKEKLKSLLSPGLRSAGVFMRDVGAGLLEVSHNSLALLGLCWLLPRGRRWPAVLALALALPLAA